MTLKNLSKQALLVILDGFAIAEHHHKNAVKDASTPHLDSLFQLYPFTTIEAGGLSVGLPEGVVGNSEVGHMNMGAGRPVRQDLVRINEAIANGTLKSRPEFRQLTEKADRIHLLALLSDGGVHSHIDHIIHVAKLLIERKKRVFLHAFMDGRDTPRDCGKRYLKEIERINNLTLASMQGRSIGMDRDRRWEKIQQAYETLVGKGAVTDMSAESWMDKEYREGRFDEFITPVLFNRNYAIREDDAIFFLNFRPDRAGQLTTAFNDPHCPHIQRDFIPRHFLCMVPYIPDEVTLPILFDKEPLHGGLSEYLSELGHKQFKIAETEKYPHVTYFFNGGRKEAHRNEDFLLIPSPKDCKTYDEKPEMSAHGVCRELLAAMEKDYTFLVVNFANGDMVGHTGNYSAAIKAIEVLDQCVGKLLASCRKKNMAMILTADHGNCDQMAYEDGHPHTSHTNAPVPFSLFHPSLKNVSLEKNARHFALKDIAPTLLCVLGIECPKTISGLPIFNEEFTHE